MTTCGRVRDLAAGYVLGALDPADMSAVREHLESCAQPHPEIEELGGVVPYLAFALDPVEPSEALKGAILTAAQADVSARERSDRAAERLIAALGSGARGRRAATRGDAPEPLAAPATAKSNAPASEAVPAWEEMPAGSGVETLVPFAPRRRRARRKLPWLATAAAAVVLAFGSGVYLSRQLSIGGTAGAPNSQASILLPNLANSRYSVPLHPPRGDAPTGVAFRLLSGKLLVTLFDLPVTKGTEVYEVWLVQPSNDAIPVAGAASSGGQATFDDISSWAIDTAKQVVVTREPAPNPTRMTGPVIVSGNLPN